MPNTLTLPVIAGQLPQGFCASSMQDLANAFAAIYSVSFPSTFTGIIVSTSKPSDTTKAWLQLDTLGRPVRLYYFSQGSWLSLHPMVPGSIMLWLSSLPDFTTFDGGDSMGLSATSGPMWQVAVDLYGNPVQARFPIAPGTLPSTAVVNVGDTGGEEKHLLTIPELPKFKAKTNIPLNVLNGGTQDGVIQALASGSTEHYFSEEVGGDTAHNTMPPYIGIYFLQRTTRQWFSIT